MSIATKLAELTQIRSDIRTALTGKGISASDHDFADFSQDIDDIQTGGGGLPTEYTQCEYIESTGTQYIDTGYVPTKKTSVILDFNFPVQPPSADIYMLYGESINGDIYDFFSVYANGGKVICKQTWGGTNGNKYLYFNFDTTRYQLSFGGGNGALGDGTNQYFINKNGTSTPNPNDYTNARNLSMYLFASHEYNNGTETPKYPSSIRVYSCKIFDNATGEKHRDFVPCYKTEGGVDIIGLYDLVNGAFYQNAGTGTFTKGADV